MKKIALIEFGDSHDEVLYPQYRFLKSHNYEVLLVVSEALKHRLFDYPKNEVHFIKSEPKFRDFHYLHRELESRKIRKVVINTASGKKVRNFVWCKPNSRLEYIGVAHNLEKIKSSHTQRLISHKIKKYYFLAEYLKERAQKFNSKIQFSDFKAAFLPDDFQTPEIKKPAHETWILIPGQVEYKRRDYLSLLRSLKGFNKEHVKFILLGKSKHKFGDGPMLEVEIQQHKLERAFKMWDDFVPNEEFYAYLSQADFILPLIHPKHVSSGLYENQISGAWNMAFSYRIPLLMESMWASYPEFEDTAHFYDLKNLKDLWPKLPELKKLSFYQKDSWSLEYAAKHYLEFLERD